MKKVLLTVAFFMSLSAGNVLANTFDGIWEGMGAQNNNTAWTIQLIIVGNQYAVNYNSLGCGGKLEFISKNESQLRFKEKLTYGKKNCIDNGELLLTKVGEKAMFEWFNKGKKEASGILSRN